MGTMHILGIRLLLALILSVAAANPEDLQGRYQGHVMGALKDGTPAQREVYLVAPRRWGQGHMLCRSQLI